MSKHKFTDEEIVKALECCAVDPQSGKFSDCKNCPLDAIGDANCFNFMIQQYALDLINRQKAEVAYWQDEAVNAKREAVKEFAERLKKYYASLNGKTAAGCVEYHIDQIAREMTEGGA